MFTASRLTLPDFADVEQVSFVVQTTLWALSVRAGYGADYLSLAEWQRFLFNKWWFLGSVFWLCTLTLYKVSILFLFNRVFVQRGFKITCWTALIITACWGVGNILGWIFQCLPVSAMWYAADNCEESITCTDARQGGVCSRHRSRLLQPEWLVGFHCRLGRGHRRSHSSHAPANGVETQPEEEGESDAHGHVLDGRYVSFAMSRNWSWSRARLTPRSVIVFSLMSCSTIVAVLPDADEKNQCE